MDDPGDNPPPNPAVPSIDPGTPDLATKAAIYSSDEILVRFKSGIGISASSALHARHGAEIVRAYRIPSNLHLVRVPSGTNVERSIQRYERDPSVLYAEPNYRYQLAATYPDDADFGALWGMDNAGQTGGLEDADINAPEAWDITTGSPDVVIGVLDTGVDYLHEDLAANMFVNPGEIAGNGVDDDGNGYVDDVHGISSVDGTGDPMDELDHGTHVSGTIAARGNNGIGVAGVNWEAQIVACKAFAPNGATLDDILVCLEYFLDLKTRPENPVDIVATNNSWGGGPFSQALYDAIDAHNQAGMLFVAAAGNDSNDNDASPSYPATYDLPNIISVLATDHNNQMAGFSSYGASTVDVGAPGLDILSTVPGNGYASFSGTSMATPHVTGLVGLLEAQDPSRSLDVIKNLILVGGDISPATESTSLSGRIIRAEGSLNCVDQSLTKRHAPASDAVAVGLGTPVSLGVLSLACEGPSTEPVSVTVTETGENISLIDANGTGNFQGVFTPFDLGTYTLTFSTGDVVTVSVVGNYDAPHVVDADYRAITGIPLNLGDDSTVEVISDFPIQFAGAAPGMTSFHVGDNGVISFTSPVFSFFNQALPTVVAETLVAPYWDDLNPAAGGDVVYEVIGTEPNRELVIEWRELPFYPNLGAVTFQVVFFENSPNILFNYLDVVFGDSFFDNGASATIGVQVTGEVARQFSFNEPSVTDGSGLLFTIGAPLAAPGPDQAVLPGTDVTLDGSASQDPNGEIVSYAWTQSEGEPVDLSGADTAVASFTAPETPGVLTFELEVTDNDGQTSVGSVDVLVNLPPVADAGRDYALGNGLEGTLDGTASYDPNGEVVGYRWEQINGERVSLTNGGTALATFVAPGTPQYLAFELTVTDEHGFSDSDVVVVEVFANSAPVASAGNDRIVRPGTTVTLDGSGSLDLDGEIASYAWSVALCTTTEGQCDLALQDADTATPVFSVPTASGIVQLSLTVTDDAGATATDSIVLGVFLQAPTAAANAGEGCADSGTSITLDGTASFDQDGSIASYEWNQVAGPTVVLSGADTALATFTAPAVEATLVFELTVTDDDRLTSTTRIEVPINAPPVAVATASALAALDGAEVTLDGAQSQDAASYAWTQIAGPTATLSDPTAASPTFVAPTPGSAFEVATFQLTVTDDCGATATAEVSVVIVAN